MMVGQKKHGKNLRMNISARKIRELNQISVYEEILKNYGYGYLSFLATDNPPEMWSAEDKRFFDMVNEIETEMKKEIINHLSVKKSYRPRISK